MICFERCNKKLGRIIGFERFRIQAAQVVKRRPKLHVSNDFDHKPLKWSKVIQNDMCFDNFQLFYKENHRPAAIFQMFYSESHGPALICSDVLQ